MMVTVIGAALRLEGSCGLLNDRPQLPQHVCYDMIGSYQQASATNLERDMPVADMPGETGEVDRIAGVNREQRFGQGADLDYGIILEKETVAIMELHRLGKVEQEGHTMIAHQG
jgi:hypothetical protein